MSDGQGVDLDAMTISELRMLAAAAEAKAREKVEAAQAAVLAETRAKLAELGISFDSLLKAPAPLKKSTPAAAPIPVKYRGPKGEEWAGRGKVPQWLADAEKHGRSKDEFKV